MARCSCSGSTGCSCRLTPGEGILISGSGTASDPFVITAEITSFASSFTVQDTDTVNLNLVGSGIPGDPFILTGESSIAMTQLSDWDDPAGPAVGEVPVWNGTAWEAAAPPTVPPGAVNVGAGLLGDGSAPDPLLVAVSDTTTTTTSGLAIYVDSAGELRAVPGVTGSVAWGDITDVPTTFPTTWADVASKPTTFPPQIGTTASTAKAGNWFPSWTEVTSKPTAFPPSAHTHAASDIGSGYPATAVGSSALGFPSNAEAVMTSLNNNKANAFGSTAAVRYSRGPDATAYGRTVTGGGFFAVWMDAGLEFGRNVSARKYKTGIESHPLDVADVLALEPVRYTLISSPDAGEQYGLIADDVALTLPEIVVFENGEPETIRYDLLAVALLDVVKDQQARLNSFDNKHNLVLARLRALEGSES